MHKKYDCIAWNVPLPKGHLSRDIIRQKCGCCLREFSNLFAINLYMVRNLRGTG